MNHGITCLSLGLFSLAAACVLSEPIGDTPQDSSTDGATGGENSSLAGGGSAGSTSEVSITDTQSSTGVDTEALGETGDPEVCRNTAEDGFSWNWSYGGYEPETIGEGPPYEADATRPLDCDVTGFDTDAAGDRLSLTLDCEVEGEPIEEQELWLSPIPSDLSFELLEDAAFSVLFRPEIVCGVGCSYGSVGWLSVRRVSDDRVMVGIVDAQRLLPPVDELLPVSVAVTDSGCGRVEIDPDCPAPGWVEPLSVVVGLPDETVTITKSGFVETLTHRVFVDQAVDGVNHECGADGADPAQIRVMVVRSFSG